MGPNIAANMLHFDYSESNEFNHFDGELARAAKSRAGDDFNLIGSFWSPVPWVKVSSGSVYGGQSTGPYPAKGTPLPAIWRGCFSGGGRTTGNLHHGSFQGRFFLIRLFVFSEVDVTDTPMLEFDDSKVGGTGQTSALTQLARSTAAYLKGYQDNYGVKFHAVSLQNELAFVSSTIRASIRQRQRT